VAQVEVIPGKAERSLSQEISHIYCCRDPDRLLCGMDGSNIPFNEESETTCVVCCDLEGAPFCPVFRDAGCPE